MADGKVIVIAEAGVNHNGDMAMARQLVDVAADAGADYVKFQTFKADRLASGNAEKAAYQQATTGRQESQQDMLRKLELSELHHVELKAYCGERGIGFLSTPFDEQSADFLVGLGVDRLKTPSGEITNLPYLEHIGSLGTPVIMSTGMSDLEEVRDAVRSLEAGGCTDIHLLHCLTNYPADPAEANLRAMVTMAGEFGYPVGYSDHTPGVAVAIAAVALGATIIEKHFTLDRGLPGPDHSASLEPGELSRLIKEVEIATSALGNGEKVPAPSEMAIKTVARKSIVAAEGLRAGDVFSARNLTVKRPGSGLAPGKINSLFGKKARVDIPADTILTEDMIA